MGKEGRQVYLNGKFVHEKDARISIYDSALMFGDMVFEMTRSFNKKQFKLREHLERLFTSIKMVRIPLKMTIQDMEDAVNKTIEVNKPLFDEDDEIRMLINVSRGPLEIYREVFDGVLEPTVVISAFPLKWVIAGLAHLYHSGIHAIVSSQRAIPAQLLDPKIKSRSRLHLLMANLEVAQYNDNNAWALLLDPDGFIAEGTGANFFIVSKGKLATPEPRNILQGIMRQYVIELAEELNIQCFERNIEPYDVITADEAFFTGTPFCILPATKFNGLNIGDGKPGPITQKLLTTWSEKVDVDIVAQADKYAKAVAELTGAGPTPYQFSTKSK